MDGFWTTFYALRLRRMRRRHRQEMATREARLRAELGHAAAAPPPFTPPSPMVPQPRRRLHLRRWVGCSLGIIVLLLLLAFLVYLVVFGVQHGYIYPAHHQG